MDVRLQRPSVRDVYCLRRRWHHR